MGVDMRMNLSLFITIYISSIFVLLVFHLIFLGLWYIGLVSRVAGRRPEILTILQNCAVLSVACCVFYSHCGNHALNEKRLGRRDSGLFTLWKKGEPSIWLKKFSKMYELKDEICKSWFAPVGSAGDYPLLSKWVLYGEFSSSGPCESSDEISPIYSLWATFIGLYMANYVVERSTGWALTHPLSVEKTEKLKNKQMKPNFLDMIPWTSADLFKYRVVETVACLESRMALPVLHNAVTELSLLAAVAPQLVYYIWAAMSRVHEGAKEDFLYDHLSEKDHLWFDFMADTGDGGNSSYSVARLLAQPTLHAINDDSIQSLPRADLLLIGGDLAYPNPSAFTYEKRFFRPFEYALQPPSWYKDVHIAVDKPELPSGVSELKQYDGPQCFLIPGNHDCVMASNIYEGWWVFGLDLALHCDIDVYQFKFFAALIKEKVKENDSVIIMTHEPNWILDWYWNDVTGKNVSHLVKDHLKGRCKLRMAGDLHHYMRHSRAQSENPDSIQHLLVNGCGGAFLHPTHVFSDFDKAYGTAYEMKAAIQKSSGPYRAMDFWPLSSLYQISHVAFDVPEVPKEWKLDSEWENEVKQPQQASHHRKFPSKWRANTFHQDPVNTVRIVDHFVIQPTDTLHVATVNGSASH
ncbi:metallo-dependent phosphatase-like protein [Tanacetum coccineum]|uniref:Metallo-dependent phosphatase-like protein n=1 Tax=Tanacetum coccineum TaxID=301880 RepID=A0ABQ5E0U7_9ASTR